MDFRARQVALDHLFGPALRPYHGVVELQILFEREAGGSDRMVGAQQARERVLPADTIGTERRDAQRPLGRHLSAAHHDCHLYRSYHGLEGGNQSLSEAELQAILNLDPPPRAVAVDDPAIVAALPPHPGLSPDRVALRLAVTPDTVERVRRTVADHGGDVTAVDDEALPALVTSVYNHALLRARRLDPAVCSLQVRGPAIVEREDAVRAALPETRLHLDGNAPRRHGKGWSGLLLSRWVDRPTLQRGIDDLRALGVQVISPHTCVLGGHGDDGRLDAIRAAAARIDRHGLLNPGKLPPAPVPEAAA